LKREIDFERVNFRACFDEYYSGVWVRRTKIK
jgi:hypothetical protein